MIVVSDTGPLNYLTLIGHVGVLEPLYRSVIVPPAVASELSRPSSPRSVRELIQSPPPWLTIAHSPPRNLELNGLGEGEQQAIALTHLLQADLLLCGDKGAREAATRSGVKVVGTLGVLHDAAQRKLLDFADAMDLLRRTNFRITKELMERILKEHR